MITDLRLCSAGELRKQIDYLAATPVAGIAALLRGGQLALKAGTIRSLATMGSLKTEFGQIGSIVVANSDAQSKFRVAEVLPLLEAHAGLDDPMLEKIRTFMRKDESGQVHFNTTLLRVGGELIIKDGNKRTIAFFERRRGWTDNVEFSVHLVEEIHDGV